MNDLLTPSPHASSYNLESVSEEEHSQHEQALPSFPQHQQPQSAVQFLQQQTGPSSTSSQSQHNRQSPSVAPSQQLQRQQSNGMYGSPLASHYQIPHNTPALDAVPPQFRILQHSHSTSELLVNPYVQQVQPRRNDQVDYELLGLIDWIVSKNVGL